MLLPTTPHSSAQKLTCRGPPGFPTTSWQVTPRSGPSGIWPASSFTSRPSTPPLRKFAPHPSQLPHNPTTFLVSSSLYPLSAAAKPGLTWPPSRVLVTLCPTVFHASSLQTLGIHGPRLSLTSCVTRSKLSNPSYPPFPYLQNGPINTYFLRLFSRIK